MVTQSRIPSFVNIDTTETLVIDRPSNEDVGYRPGDPFAIKNLVGRGDSDAPGPQATVVVAPRDITVGAHFHSVQQFQLYFPSTGTWFQRHEIDTPMLHFLDAYVSYGPFGSAESFEFYTLRAQATTEPARFMPRDRDKLIRRGRRNILVELPFGDRERSRSIKVKPIIEPDPDGLAAVVVVAGPGATMKEAVVTSGAGRYYWVLSGAVVAGGDIFGPRSLAWCDPDVEVPQLGAGPDGCELLIMQFPVEESEPAQITASS
jgi:hypothetical protein